MQTCVNIQTATEDTFISTVLLPHKGKCTGTYTGKMVDGTAVITCGKCGAGYEIEMNTALPSGDGDATDPGAGRDNPEPLGTGLIKD